MMNAKAAAIAVVLAASIMPASATAQDQDDANSAMLEQFERMHGVTVDFQATDDAAERRALMRDHMRLMQQMMDESGGMMGGDGDPASMRSQMVAMHQMMMQMMAQQGMMMDMMQGEDAGADESEHGEHHE